MRNVWLCDAQVNKTTNELVIKGLINKEDAISCRYFKLISNGVSTGVEFCNLSIAKGSLVYFYRLIKRNLE